MSSSSCIDCLWVLLSVFQFKVNLTGIMRARTTKELAEVVSVVQRHQPDDCIFSVNYNTIAKLPLTPPA